MMSKLIYLQHYVLFFSCSLFYVLFIYSFTFSKFFNSSLIYFLMYLFIHMSTYLSAYSHIFYHFSILGESVPQMKEALAIESKDKRTGTI